jgi:prolipoprotein diacylglyceryltransferase
MGFFGACVWIYLTANEIVASLQSIGIALNITTTILGLTVLAWGNSIPGELYGHKNKFPNCFHQANFFKNLQNSANIFKFNSKINYIEYQSHN